MTTGKLVCRSFHSVKGGVGKSTLATALALTAARKFPDNDVTLIDLDLTGTSLSDVLPLRAPTWLGDAQEVKHRLVRTPDGGFLTRSATLDAVRRREFAEVVTSQTVPFLNDYLLFSTPDWDGIHDVNAEAIQWKYDGGPENLRVIPSSALPVDLERILPVIFDEQHSAFLEARLEILVAALVPDAGKTRYIVWDVPPTIPGLSRSVLSLCMRLGGDNKVSLVIDEPLSPGLKDANIHWRANLVMTPDLQDIRAGTRWLRKLLPAEEQFIKVIVNRHRESSDKQALDAITKVLRPSLTLMKSGPPNMSIVDDVANDWHPLFDSAGFIRHDARLEFFNREQKLETEFGEFFNADFLGES